MMELMHPAAAPKAQHKDKLAETKKQEAAVHDALKAQQKEAKATKEQKRHEESHTFKEEREYNLELDPEGKHSKRAVKEQRELLKHAEKAATGAMCQHGVQRCKICFPHASERTKHHEHERGPARGADEVVE
ncbi:hypothetical protein HXX76_004048 [Chlamydomonas incerta]|uniref:Uncharacterized protein n=1 Tax=Chlamydomonas incerta TaxID=51695 RepID=A0A835T6V8_CHLIN|nr:hypothetical protein HXX76_004048 [Chlamydomonas incerta]|eukprot:KAG2439929.1 hypothetical protein HXX76_004048 [Chlamydomonas incerta]